MTSNEWRLPPTGGAGRGTAPRSLQLDRDEFLLVDWLICGAARLLPDCSIEELRQWDEVRFAVWNALRFADACAIADPPKVIPATQSLTLGRNDALILFALAPTTFRWGTGPDCGYSLKSKLSAYLEG